MTASGPLIVLFGTLAFAYLIEAVFVGATICALRTRFDLRVFRRTAPLYLFGVFAFLDLYWIPAIVVLDLRLKILNPAVVEILGKSGEFPAIELLSFGWFDIVVWAVQVLVAVWVADRMSFRPLGGTS